MWDAELHLRLYDPQRSLPYQYKALKLLKEISNDSRVYVHKTGFDAPPIKEDKRLSGDLKDIRTSDIKKYVNKGRSYPSIRRAIKMLSETSFTSSHGPSQAEKEILSAAGNELAALAIEQPGKYLKTLSLLSDVTNDKVHGGALQKTTAIILSSLWTIIPASTSVPSSSESTITPVDKAFIKTLNNLPNE